MTRIFALLATATASTAFAADRPPNVVFFLADDLGWGDVGCFGQTKIRTPNIDRLAKEGMKFTTHYAGSNVCAPSRCALMTGLHNGHAPIRDNRQAKGFPEGQVPVPPGSLKLPLSFHARNYVVGGFGKWGLGPVTSTGDPLKQGFDRFFGYNCQAVAHNSYPTHLWDDANQVTLKNPKFSAHPKPLPVGADLADPTTYAKFSGSDYAPDVIGKQALRFVRDNKDKPFFLYYPTTVPHLALQVPADSAAEYETQLADAPYTGVNGYTPSRTPHAAYAGMVTRMDRELGRVLNLLAELKLEGDTIVVFTSDNGPLYGRLGGTDSGFFNSAGPFRGRKGSFLEGGFRVPMVIRYPGKIAPGTTSDRVTGFEDWLPTLCELTGAASPTEIDGVSFAPTLLGQSQPPREFLYRESPGYDGEQAVRVGDWKYLRENLKPGKKAKRESSAPQLYDLAADPGETIDLAAKRPEVVARLKAVAGREHVASKLFPLPALDGK